MSCENPHVGVYFSEDEMRQIAERFSRALAEYTEKIVEALLPAAEAMGVALGISYDAALEAAYKIEALFNQVDDIIKVERTRTPPKKYKMPVRHYPRRTSVHYNYIPRAPRNLPYMRRAY